MANHTNTSNIRRIYCRPWQDSSPANPGKVATCVQVAVRPETTFITYETMPGTLSNRFANGTSLTGISGVRVFNGDSNCLRLVLDKGLQLPPCPAMQTRADTLTGFDPLAIGNSYLRISS